MLKAPMTVSPENTFVFAQSLALVPPSAVPQYTKTVVGAAPVLERYPLSVALVSVTSVALELAMTGVVAGTVAVPKTSIS